MDEFYGKGKSDKKHQSPTKRLIKQKDTAVEHKKMLKDNFDSSSYSLTYVTGGGKSYVITPAEGKIDYKLAEKNPLKFYDKIFS